MNCKIKYHIIESYVIRCIFNDIENNRELRLPYNGSVSYTTKQIGDNSWIVRDKITYETGIEL